MAMRGFGWVSILVVVFFGGLHAGFSALADEGGSPKRWVLSEAHGDGSRTLIVIDEDLSLRDDPTVLSQKLIFKRKYSAAESADFAAAKARYESERPLALRDPSFRKGKPLWIAVKDEWTKEDEDAYSEWFAESVRSDFLRGTGLNADCADVGLTFRWVYARDHGLPIANTLSGSGKLFGNFTGSSAWDQLPTNADWRRDERFKAALRVLYDETYTWSIQSDQYPVEITREHVRPGTMYMIIRSEGGHTQTVSSITDSGGVRTYWGNEPAAEAIYDTSLIVEFGNRKGFQNWRHVRRTVQNGVESWRLVPGVEMPGYSREQLETGYTNGTDWMNWVYAKLGYHMTDEQRYAVFAKTFGQSIDFRRAVTGVGSLFCGPGAPCASTSAAYDNYSTFSRDARLKDLRDELRALAGTIEDEGGNTDVIDDAMRALEARGEIVAGSGATYADALARDGVIESWSADPNVSYLARWGYAGVPSANLAASASADAFLEAVKSRESLVQSAWYQCHYWTCTGDEPSVRALETSALDAKVKAAYPELARKAADPGVSAATLRMIRALYRGIPLQNFTAGACASGSGCTAEDVVWGTGAADRIPNWSSKPTDALTARWGF